MGSASATSTYLSVPPVTTPREIINKSTAVDNDTSIVTIAAKVNTSIPSGYYTNTIVFTTMTNVAPPANSYPTNISSTNPGIIDVYPTTGYACYNH